MRYRTKIKIKSIVVGTFLWIFNIAMLILIIALFAIAANHSSDRFREHQMQRHHNH